MAGAKGTVDLEAVSVVQEGAAQGEEDFLRREGQVRGGSRRTYAPETTLLPGVRSVL